VGGVGCADANALRSAEVVTTLENPGIDGNQSDELTDAHPATPTASNTTVPMTVEHRS
jgi:hypothetical protein